MSISSSSSGCLRIVAPRSGNGLEEHHPDQLYQSARSDRGGNRSEWHLQRIYPRNRSTSVQSGIQSVQGDRKWYSLSIANLQSNGKLSLLIQFHRQNARQGCLRTDRPGRGVSPVLLAAFVHTEEQQLLVFR